MKRDPFDPVKSISADSFVDVLEIQRNGSGYRCPRCSGRYEVISHEGRTSGHCWNGQCELHGFGPRGTGWAHVVGARLWGCSCSEAAERVLAATPEVEVERTNQRQASSHRLSIQEARERVALFLEYK
jgi:hypothetical protein